MDLGLLGRVETDRVSRGPAMRFRQQTEEAYSIACSKDLQPENPLGSDLKPTVEVGYWGYQHEYRLLIDERAG